MSADLWAVLDMLSACLLLIGALLLCAVALRDAFRAWREGGGE